MRNTLRLVALILASCLGGGQALSQVGGYPSLGPGVASALAKTLSINGGVVPSAANNADLNALPSTYSSYVIRAGFASVGDAPMALYRPQATCPYNGGVADGGACVATSDSKFWVLMPQPQGVDARLWGAVGNSTSAGGGTDSTAAINYALAYCGAVSGRVVLGGGQYLVNSANLTVPSFCTFGGGQWIGDEGANAGVDENTVPAIILNPAYTINVANNGSFDGLAVFQKGIVAPVSARTMVTGYASFTGTAITSVGGSTMIRNAYVVGFNQCWTSVNNQRPMVEHFRGDCTNGLNVVGANDVGYIRDAEMWPFYAQNSAYGDTTYAVSGAANSSGKIAVTIPTSNVLIAGDTVTVSGVGGFTGANNRWTVASVTSGVVVLNQIAGQGGGASQSTPTTTGTWAAGSTQIVVASLGSLAVGQSCTATNLSGPILGIDYNAKTLIFAAASITGSGSGATITCANGAYTSGGALDLVGDRTGAAFAVADSQGYSLTDTFSGGWDTGYNLYSVNTNGNAYWTQLNNAKCDDAPLDGIPTCVNVNGSSGKPVMGAIWNGGLSTNRYATAFFVNAWTNVNAGAQNKMAHVNASQSLVTEVPVSVQTGSASLSDVDFNGGSNYFFSIADTIASLHIVGCECGLGALSFVSVTGQNATFGDLSNRFVAASMGGGASPPGNLAIVGLGGIVSNSTSGATPNTFTATTGNPGSVAAFVNTGSNGAGISLQGNGANPNKTVRVNSGALQVVNSAFSATIAQLADSGAWYTAGTVYGQASLPAISSCGGSPPAASAGSNNNQGQFTTGTGAPTACTVTFAVGFPSTASCTISPANAAAGLGGAYISSQSNSAFTVTMTTGETSAKFNYTCGGT